MYSLVVCTYSFFPDLISSSASFPSSTFFIHIHIMGGLSSLTMTYVLSSHSITPSHTCTAAAWWAVAAVLFIVERMSRVVGSNHRLPPFPLGACTPFSLTVSMFRADCGLDVGLQELVACWCVSHWAPLPLGWPGTHEVPFLLLCLECLEFFIFPSQVSLSFSK